jgi:hypothetical protein
MRWSPPRSRALALAGLALGAVAWAAPGRLRGQDPVPPSAPASVADLEQRVKALDGSISRALHAGRIAEAIPPARERLDLLERGLGKDHWRTGDGRRELETCRRLAGLPRAVQDRYAKARQADARAAQLKDLRSLPSFEEIVQRAGKSPQAAAPKRIETASSPSAKGK